jgi:hypothetical protein
MCRLLFNPIIEWWRKGPINAQLRQFVWSSAPIVRPFVHLTSRLCCLTKVCPCAQHYKISMLAYMFSYCTFCLPFSLPNAVLNRL